jgi:hypothetical protein
MSVQVQLRRDTLANVLLNHGAAGELFVSNDTHEIFVQDGAGTNGGFRASGVRSLFGSLAQPALAESTGVGGETLTAGVTTYTTSLQLPAGYKFIMGAGWLVKTTITGITTIDFGVTGSATLFAAAQSPSLTAGSTVIYGQNQVRFDAAPVSLLLTSHAGTNFTAGAIRFVVHYILLSPPTS